MPLYLWKNKQTGEVVEVNKPISESDVPPDGDGEWEKQLNAPRFVGYQMKPGRYTKPNKGRW